MNTASTIYARCPAEGSDRNSARALELLQRRHAAMQLLVEELKDSRSAFVQLDLEAMHRHTAEQETLCAVIRFLDRELVRVFDSYSSVKLTAGEAERARTLRGQIRDVNLELQHLSKVHSELLRHSRRSTHLLLNLIATHSATYQPNFNEFPLTSWRTGA